jgi:hypothetical protein
LPSAPHLQAFLAPWAEPRGEFTLYELPARLDVGPQYTADGDFGGQLQLLGYDIVEGCAEDGPCSLATYWQVTAPADGLRRIFLHAVDDSGEIIAQDDRLGAPAEHWQTGDLIIQLLTLPETTEELRLGVYDPVSEARLRLEDGGEYLVISAPESQ